MTNYDWAITTLLFFSVAINYMDRQVLSLTWKDFIAPEFHWTNNILVQSPVSSRSFMLSACCLPGGLSTGLTRRKGSSVIGVWSAGAVLHAFCGINATSGIVAGKWFVGFEEARKIIGTVDNIGMITSVSVTLFIF